MRYECTEPGFEGAYVVFRARGWTRKQMADFLTIAVGDADWWQLLHSRIEAVHLPAIVGESLTKAEHLTADDLERIDYVHYRWFWAAVDKFAKDVVNLGEAARRRLWPMPEATAEHPQTQP
jgi:hypothetical protein